MKKAVTSILSTLIVIIFTGCTTNNGPSVDLLMHSKASKAKVTYNFSGISKEKKLFIHDITMDADKEEATGFPEYDNHPEFRAMCAPGAMTIRILREEGFTVVETQKEADYIVTMENIGCGKYGQVKDKIRTPKMSQISNDIDTKYAQNATSYANTAAGLSSAGANPNLSGGFAALSLISLFGRQDMSNVMFSVAYISVQNKETGLIENAVYHTVATGGAKRGDSGLAENCNMHIANRFEMEIDEFKLHTWKL